MTAETPLPLLESLLAVLLEQEEVLGSLLGLAQEEQRALVHSDFPVVERVGNQMLALAREMDELDVRREAIVSSLGAGETLADIDAFAGNVGETRFAKVRARLLEQADRLRDAQEFNARLILDATRLQERWFGILAGMGPSTYGPGGRPKIGGRGIVSRTA
jgi:flagellar biosynthesis/type III secretory pathway chaperone